MVLQLTPFGTQHTGRQDQNLPATCTNMPLSIETPFWTLRGTPSGGGLLSYLQPKKTMFLVTVQCHYRKYYSRRRPSVSSSSACPMHIPSGEVHVTCTQVPKGRTQPLLRTQPLYAIHTHTMWCNTRLRYLGGNRVAGDTSGSQQNSPSPPHTLVVVAGPLSHAIAYAHHVSYLTLSMYAWGSNQFLITTFRERGGQRPGGRPKITEQQLSHPHTGGGRCSPPLSH